MARLGKDKKAQRGKGLETSNDTQAQESSRDDTKALAQTKKNRVKVYKIMTLNQARLKDDENRRQDTKKAHKVARTALIGVRQDMRKVFTNASKDHGMIKREEEIRKNILAERENKNKRQNTAVSWKPTSSNTVNTLFDAKPKIHKPFVDRSAMEWEELRFLSPRSFRSHKGRGTHESKKPIEFKKRTEFFTHVPQNENGVFQYHRPLSARQNPNHYERHSKRRQRPSTAVAKTSMIKHEKRKRTHRHFRYHLHAKHMTTFKSGIAQSMDPYASILQQRVLDASKRDRTSINGIPPPKTQNIYSRRAPSRPQTAKARFAYIDTGKGCVPERAPIQKHFPRRPLNEKEKNADNVLQTRAYGHYSMEKESMKHDDVIKAFLVSKSHGTYLSKYLLSL